MGSVSEMTTMVAPAAGGLDLAAAGLEAGAAKGWAFARAGADADATAGERDAGVRAAAGLGLVVLAPAGFSVRAGRVVVEGNGTGSAAADAEVARRFTLEDDRLTIRLPLATRPGARVLVLPPPGGLSSEVEPRTTSYGGEGGARDLAVVWRLRGQRPLSVRAGEPIAQVVPIAVPPPAPVAPAPIAGAAPESVTSADGFTLRVWRLHPAGARLVPAEKTLRGDAPHGAVRWCGPFTHANSYGFWVFPPVDLDVIWYGGRSFDHKLHTPYADDEVPLVKSLERPEDAYKFQPRQKVDFGGVLDPVVSIWTGCIFQTPPGWGLLIRTPINVGASAIFKVQEGILETDWLPYDIWMNLLFVQQDKWVHLRREAKWPPVAQLVPVRRDAYDPQWRLVEGPLERTTPEGARLYDRWNAYNYKKWIEHGQKEPATYHKERKRYLSSGEDYPSAPPGDGPPKEP